MSKQEILIIDDEPQIRKLLRITLESNDYNVQEASSAKEGLVMAANHPPALILLDIGLPDKNGHLVLKELKHWFTHPVIILSVIDKEEDIIHALDNGADDYLVKPFRTGELLARIRTALRKETKGSDPVIKTGDLVIDLSLRTARKKEEQIKLTSTEYSLLAFLAKNDGRVLTHRHLLKEIWGPGHENESQYLRVFIAQLRKKIEDNPNEPTVIITEPGVGYRFISKE